MRREVPLKKGIQEYDTFWTIICLDFDKYLLLLLTSSTSSFAKENVTATPSKGSPSEKQKKSESDHSLHNLSQKNRTKEFF